MFHGQFCYELCFLKFGARYITGQLGRVHSKECSICLDILFVVVVVVFNQKIVFIIFDEVSSFRNRIFTNQKPELVI